MYLNIALYIFSYHSLLYRFNLDSIIFSFHRLLSYFLAQLRWFIKILPKLFTSINSWLNLLFYIFIFLTRINMINSFIIANSKRFFAFSIQFWYFKWIITLYWTLSCFKLRFCIMLCLWSRFIKIKYSNLLFFQGLDILW